MRGFAGQVLFTLIERLRLRQPCWIFCIDLIQNQTLTPDLNTVWMLLLGNQYILKTKQPEYLYGCLCIHYLPHLSQGPIQQLW